MCSTWARARHLVNGGERDRPSRLINNWLFQGSEWIYLFGKLYFGLYLYLHFVLVCSEVAVKYNWYFAKSSRNPHSLANITVVQLRPKSTTGNGFYWSISMTFVFGYDPPVILWPQFLRCVKAPYSYNPALNETHTHKQTEPAATPGPPLCEPCTGSAHRRTDPISFVVGCW